MTRLLEGDCLEVLPTLEAGSVDAVCCDPPYGLAFMGREWDSFGGRSNGNAEKDRDAPHRGPGKGAQPFGYSGSAVGDHDQTGRFADFSQQWAAAALRVVKPGGYLLAFGGTRTFHRLACALEDAGWECRDTICWHFGSGFPKGKGCLKPAWESITVAQKPLVLSDDASTIVGNLSLLESQLWSLLPADIAASLSSGTPAGRTGKASSVPRSAALPPISLGGLSALTDTPQFASAASTCLSIVSSWKGTLAGAFDETNTSTTGTGTRPTIDWKTLKSCLLALTLPGIIGAELQAPGSRLGALPAARYLNAACLSIDSTRELSALESAMSAGRISPRDGIDLGRSTAWEPILLCRKPGPRVLPLGIEECRIDSPVLDGERRQSRRGASDYFALGDAQEGERHNPAGRWPANVTHDGSPEVLEAFAAFGTTSTTGKRSERSRNAAVEGTAWGTDNHRSVEYANEPPGTTARFFYCAKASRRERGEGNGHPTVKPLALVRWLVRLVAPEGGAVLDPFAGSGTTALACQAEGRDCVLIEREPAYCDIIRRRLAEAEGPLFAAGKGA